MDSFWDISRRSGHVEVAAMSNDGNHEYNDGGLWPQDTIRKTISEREQWSPSRKCSSRRRCEQVYWTTTAKELGPVLHTLKYLEGRAPEAMWWECTIRDQSMSLGTLAHESGFEPEFSQGVK
ncbi:hypothetical protein AXG93_855s1060 [Marchantia polymorpha subsp. ruderalis]|uniref:Uncharacterized protein n=1 Tax=Marchantia polymorpha subsp. ruderalis TaxID=1480154 RepID=A0A176VWS1_MARPO|nr:hypothetical protein AXG93_855s1060 [Marchantia polymorpha subsp. ruderalis]